MRMLKISVIIVVHLLKCTHMDRTKTFKAFDSITSTEEIFLRDEFIANQRCSMISTVRQFWYWNMRPQARIQKILNRGEQTVKIIRLNRGAQIYFLVLHIRANRGRAPGAPPLHPRLRPRSRKKSLKKSKQARI